MGKTTGISWADATWNPWMGCTKLSKGCTHCYAEREMIRFGKDFNTVTRSKTTFRDPLKWKTPKIIFVCSWSDFFHPDVPLDWLDDAWEIMFHAKEHTFLILTKRPENMPSMMPSGWVDGMWKYQPNVWLGVSAENQARADERIPKLLEIPAPVHFVSAEPLLGPISLRKWIVIPSTAEDVPEPTTFRDPSKTINWVITGGESGQDCRPANLDWVRNIRDQCIDYNIPFHHKQHGGTEKIDGTWGGRELDGKIWDEMPPNRIRGGNGG